MKKLRTGDIIFETINYSVFILFTLLCIYPFYYIFICTLSTPSQVLKGVVYLWPSKFTFENYISIFKLPGIPQAAVISILRTIIGSTITVFCSALVAYLVTKKELYGRKFIYRYFIFTMYASGGLIPSYILMTSLHLDNNFLIYVIPGAINAFFIILVKTFIEQIPPSLEESAMMDGASVFTIFTKIILPVSMPIIATITVFNSVGQWNSWYDNFLYVSNAKLDTLQYILLKYLKQSEALSRQLSLDASRNRNLANNFVLTPMAVRMTITMVVTLPIIFVYPFLQKYFVKGIMMGAIKG